MLLANRRRFLSWALGAGASLGLGAAAWRRAPSAGAGTAGESAAPAAGEALFEVTRTSWAMGADVALTVLHERREVAERAASAALGELSRVEDIMSLYRPASQLCRLNRDGLLRDPHPYLVEVLRAAEAVSRRTGGAFDVTVQPLWPLYAAAKKAGRLPDDADIDAARRHVDWRQIDVADDCIQIRAKGAAVTLNGIAQGFAADRVTAVLRKYGIEHALINTGEIGTLGAKADGAPWKVGVQHPRREDAYIALAALRGRCLATSGDYATRFSDDYRAHHIFDPHTGRSPQALASVSIVAPTATAADALSKPVFVLGPEKGLELVRATPGADALLVLKDGRTLSTAGFPETA